MLQPATRGFPDLQFAVIATKRIILSVLRESGTSRARHLIWISICWKSLLKTFYISHEKRISFLKSNLNTHHSSTQHAARAIRYTIEPAVAKFSFRFDRLTFSLGRIHSN